MTDKREDFKKRMNKMGAEGTPFLFIIDYEINTPLIFHLSEAAKNGVFYHVKRQRNYKETVSGFSSPRFVTHPVEYSTYHDAFKRVITQIRRGNSLLLNLTFPTEIETDWSLRTFFEQSVAPYKLLYKDQFVLFSPETFVRISDGVISSFPMKGTIDASVPQAVEVILQDEKEKAEHATIVDLIRNDLSMVAREVTVKKYRYIQEIVTHDKKLLQVSSEISGILPTDYQSYIGDIILQLLPAGSICGAPKRSTLKIISETETYSRGFYTGVFGIFDGTDLDSAVMIRFIEQDNGKYYYKSGGGITINSNPEKEYQELIDKVYVATH